MTPNTTVRINSYGQPYHGCTGTIARMRKMGPAELATINLHRPIKPPGSKWICQVHVFTRQLKEIDDIPTPSTVEPEPETVPEKTLFVNQSTRPAPYDLVPVSRMAKTLGIHIETAKRIIRRGDLDGWRVGRTWAVSESEMEKFAETYVKRTGPKPKGVTIEP